MALQSTQSLTEISTRNLPVGRGRPARKADNRFFIYFFNSGLRCYWQCGHSWSIVPASGDSEDDCGEADGM
jgi:hypothetical protein